MKRRKISVIGAGNVGGTTAQRLAERMEGGNIVVLLADGGWKYLSTNLWTKEYEELGEEVEGKVWW